MADLPKELAIHFATKGDMAELRAELSALATKTDLAQLDTRVADRVAQAEVRNVERIAALEGRITWRVIGAAFAAAVVLFAALRYIPPPA